MALKHVEGRIVAKVDLNQKNFFTFSNGQTIHYERYYDNFDRKHTQQVMGVVVSAENIPTDALILFHHNSTHESYQIHNHSKLSGEEIASGIKYFSIMERDCFFWKMPGEKEWQPTKGYATGLRVFKKYEGLIQGVEPKLIPDTLFVTSGKYKNSVVRTAKASDYMLTFRDPETGRDVQLIRFRPDGIESEEREPEAVCVINQLTDQVKTGDLLVGISVSDCAIFHVEGIENQINAYAD